MFLFSKNVHSISLTPLGACIRVIFYTRLHASNHCTNSNPIYRKQLHCHRVDCVRQFCICYQQKYGSGVGPLRTNHNVSSDFSVE